MNLAILDQPPTKFSMDHAGVAGKLMEDSHGFFRVGPEGRDWQRCPQSSLYISLVADGSSQQMSAANASHLALQTIERVMQQQPADMPVHQRIDEAIRFAHQTILEAIRNNPSLRGMSTTLSMAVIEGWRLYIAYVGNSRILLIREGKLYPLTVDPTEKIATSTDQHLVEGQNWRFSASHVPTRLLGTEKPLLVEHSILLPGSNMLDEGPRKESSLELLPGDIVLLCTDGLSHSVSEQEIASAFQLQQPKHAVRQLITMALDNRQEDNLTAAVLVMPESDRRAWASPRVIDVGALLISAILALLLLVGATWSGIAIGEANGWKQIENFTQSLLTDTNASAPSANGGSVALTSTATKTHTITLPTAVMVVAVTDAISDTVPSPVSSATPLETSKVMTPTSNLTGHVLSLAPVATNTPITISTPITESRVISPTISVLSDTTESGVTTRAPSGTALLATQTERQMESVSGARLSTDTVVTGTKKITGSVALADTPATEQLASDSKELSSSGESSPITFSVASSIELSSAITLPNPVAADSLLTATLAGGSQTGKSQISLSVPVTTAETVALPQVTDTPTSQNAGILIPTATFVPSPTPMALVFPTVDLLEPMETVLSDSWTFSWKSETELAASYNYELIFWEIGRDPMAMGFSPVGASRATSVRVDLNTAALGTLQGVLMPGRMYQWGVALVDAAQTNRRLTLLASGPQFLFQLADNNVKPAVPAAAPTNTPVPPPPNTPVPPPPPADTPVPPTETNAPAPTATEDCPRIDPNCKTTGTGTN